MLKALKAKLDSMLIFVGFPPEVNIYYEEAVHKEADC